MRWPRSISCEGSRKTPAPHPRTLSSLVSGIPIPRPTPPLRTPHHVPSGPHTRSFAGPRGSATLCLRYLAPQSPPRSGGLCYRAPPFSGPSPRRGLRAYVTPGPHPGQGPHTHILSGDIWASLPCARPPSLHQPSPIPIPAGDLGALLCHTPIASPAFPAGDPRSPPLTPRPRTPPPRTPIPSETPPQDHWPPCSCWSPHPWSLLPSGPAAKIPPPLGLASEPNPVSMLPGTRRPHPAPHHFWASRLQNPQVPNHVNPTRGSRVWLLTYDPLKRPPDPVIPRSLPHHIPRIPHSSPLGPAPQMPTRDPYPTVP
nr:extensin-like [Loxodonta africana]